MRRSGGGRPIEPTGSRIFGIPPPTSIGPTVNRNPSSINEKLTTPSHVISSTSANPGTGPRPFTATTPLNPLGSPNAPFQGILPPLGPATPYTKGDAFDKPVASISSLPSSSSPSLPASSTPVVGGSLPSMHQYVSTEQFMREIESVVREQMLQRDLERVKMVAESREREKELLRELDAAHRQIADVKAALLHELQDVRASLAGEIRQLSIDNAEARASLVRGEKEREALARDSVEARLVASREVAELRLLLDKEQTARRQMEAQVHALVSATQVQQETIKDQRQVRIRRGKEHFIDRHISFLVTPPLHYVASVLISLYSYEFYFFFHKHITLSIPFLH